MLKTITLILLLFLLAVIGEYGSPVSQTGAVQSAMVMLR